MISKLALLKCHRSWVVFTREPPCPPPITCSEFIPEFRMHGHSQLQLRFSLSLIVWHVDLDIRGEPRLVSVEVEKGAFFLSLGDQHRPRRHIYGAGYALK
jgi:hypothetical protein